MNASAARVTTGRTSAAPASVDEGEDGGHEEQCSHRREDQSADHGAAKRRVLLPAFSNAQRHGTMPMIIASAVINTGGNA